MGEYTAVAVPAGILGAIAVVMFLFLFWWFPRHWQKGIRADMAEVDEARRQRELAAQENGTASGGELASDANTKLPTQAKLTYLPPVAGY